MTELDVDWEGNISLRWRIRKHKKYLASEDADGTIHLVPAVLVPARLLDNNPLREIPVIRDQFALPEPWENR
jgi:hypothetical protein